MSAAMVKTLRNPIIIGKKEKPKIEREEEDGNNGDWVKVCFWEF